MPAAAVYVRVSTEDQARHGYSLQSQVDACRVRAESLGATEVRLFADEGVSGAILSRPGLSALRETVRSRSVSLVVVWDPDRLSRNLSHQLLLTEEIEQAKVRLEFVNFEWKSTPEGQLFYALRGAIAQYEKEKIRERTGRGRLQKARQGKLPAAFRPYGYDYDSVTSLLVVQPEEARIVRTIFRWFASDGEGPGAIARRLNDLGVPSRKGGQWHREVVRQILANPVYTGVFHANRWDTAGCSLNRHRPPEERVSPQLRPAAEWVPVAVPPLVEPELFQRARELLAQARRLWAGRPRAEYLLSGLLVCGRCGMSMSGFVGQDWGVRRRKYTCRRSGGGGGWCGQALAAEPLEEAIWALAAGWLADPEALAGALPEAAGAQEAGLAGELATVADGLARAEQGRATLLSLLEQGLLPAVEAAEALGRVQARLTELGARRRALEARQDRAGARVEAAAEAWRATVAAHLPRLRDGSAMPAVARRRLIRLLVGRVTVDGRTAVAAVHWPAVFAAPE
jgi:site-specific DNA recombinase